MISLTSPVKTRAHDWPAGAKLAALCVVTVVLFRVQDIWVHLAVLAGIGGIYALPGRVFLLTGLRRLRMLWPFLALIVVWHGLTGTPVQGAVIALRLVSAVAFANLVTMTTRLDDMIAVVRWLASPLRRFGVKTQALELAIALVIRFTPVLIDKGTTLTQAWRARSGRTPGWRIILPFTILAMDDADHVADALRARGGLQNVMES
ncbi:energy-coupling factor transporter transmembrane component T family protein [Actibacterium sp. XHP0104]|uniref:energy-coupling factor transporter transmembrane component T family protein n=1 Tax=Actibacterium sp. XHP0104 TaxID=2984335 RepID=UPI0021E6EF37|nr:energy-coupling factor transporter transmembrane protein EcfT [Actibacterium sp. XHP0104]MCV2882229.1 energy-coupling factor transporter transmembrane protein EcfT [Actibacterium sp. XHP0104]